MNIRGVLVGVVIGLAVGIISSYLIWKPELAESQLSGSSLGTRLSGVTGIGGVFFRSGDPAATMNWYAEHLGVPVRTIGTEKLVLFEWRDNNGTQGPAHTVWSPMPLTSDYFDITSQRGADFMINYRVADMDNLLAKLRSSGIRVLGDPQVSFNGRFAWVVDLDGRKLELWEPGAGF